jgi:hypothetical protein
MAELPIACTLTPKALRTRRKDLLVARAACRGPRGSVRQTATEVRAYARSLGAPSRSGATPREACLGHA